ncbi:MAG: biotin/lipoyl-binding protein [Gammaproteobacteria bacterium]|nr:biotin/lipoyl-binding protein [Gammaproteobacteria bacterium]MCY4358226.1 biotin/lipoyl-binding protein [Gammaproteobacteria bacterium]
MNPVEKRYLAHIETLKALQVPRADKAITILMLLLLAVSVALLQFTPWVQTAYGDGVVSTVNPAQRTQAISALVPGQIETWHVREGDRVKQGEPIVTLRDTDEDLIGRLQAQISSIEMQQAANETALRTAENDLVRRQSLFEQGLASKRDVEQVQIRIEGLKAEAAATSAELNQVRVSLARQSIQTKVAPSDGTIMRLMSAGNSTFVKSGDMLASFIPDGVERSVALIVSGLDAPLVYPGRQVRLQFDGWPMFQFSGWPAASVGTFLGEVEFVEPIADATGRFRVWVREDLSEGGWPDEQYVRLGSRVRGWILLEEVSLGYELWRQLNGFPPVNNTFSEV